MEVVIVIIHFNFVFFFVIVGVFFAPVAVYFAFIRFSQSEHGSHFIAL